MSVGKHLSKTIAKAIKAAHPQSPVPTVAAFCRVLIFEAIEARIADSQLPLQVLDGSERPHLFPAPPKPKELAPATVAANDLSQVSALLMQTVELLSKLNVSADNSSIVPPRYHR